MTESQSILSIPLGHYLETAIHAADQARAVTQKWFRADLKVASKQDKTPVTIADRQTEQAIKDIVLQRYPDHSFFGEETGQQLNNDQWQWVIDPIDGTKCFATGMPTFGTLICLLHKQAPVIGIIDHPILDERWIGIQGCQTTHNGKVCCTRSTDSLDNATVYTTSMDMFDGVSGKQARALTKNCQFRVFGGDCYSYGLLASGYNDMVCEADLKPYDYFALIVVVTGAGGIITDWQGNQLTLESNGEVLASANESLHQQAIAKLNEF
ncbi:inositol monophosphatase family protein [Candidatus Spongiihabitans sp.]|uniref:inositol monophosphatase family protein n=1 Tax=Candidatus Spongiihabitans sp. TaxID=3101308 RepID=UPI003C703B4B